MVTKSKPEPPQIDSEPEAAAPETTNEPIARVLDTNERLDKAQHIVQRNIYWAMGAGVLPLPLVDVVAITGVQLKMLRELSQLYGRPFREGVAKKAIASLITGVGGVSIGGLLGASLVKFIPVVGQSLGVVSVPVVSGMFTHAVGRTFVMHFESGGTVLDFDPKSMRAYFEQEYGKAKEIVTEMKDKGEPSGARTPA
ncbi:MAG: DUF697 domain-containing protein [Myxococcota bacterium]